jgi:glutathione S-transferase
MSAKPVLYLKDKCPFCLKLLVYLLEARLLDGIEVRSFVPGEPEEAELRAELAPHFETVTFPAAQIEPGVYMKDSDAIIGYFAEKSGVDPADLPVLQWYARGPFASIGALYRENRELKEKLGA